jgi:hypothetical protein
VGDADPADAPRLPLLSSILRHATRSPLPHGWRDALTRRWAPASAGSAPGAVAAKALPPAAGDAWLAIPMHLQVTPDHLRLPAGGLLQLDEGETRTLAADFARDFGESGLQLQPTRGRFVLRGLAAPEDPDTHRDPAEMLGSRLAARARGDLQFRRLSSEIELWLHAHPLNETRSARGRPAISTLWLWGGGAVPLGGRMPVRATPLRFLAEDPFMDGLASLTGVGSVSPPDATAAREVGRMDGDVVVQLALSTRSDGTARSLESIEGEWLQPALERLRRGELRSIELLMGPLRASLTRSAFYRVWRRARPWWEYLRG